MLWHDVGWNVHLLLMISLTSKCWKVPRRLASLFISPYLTTSSCATANNNSSASDWDFEIGRDT